MSFLSEWYYTSIERNIPKKTALATIQLNNQQLERKLQNIEKNISRANRFALRIS